MFEIDFGNYLMCLPCILDFRKAFGRGGMPFYARSAGMFGSIMGRSEDISNPLLHIGHVKYYWFDLNQW